MKVKQFAVADFATAGELKEIRKKLNLTQKEFAALIGSSKSTIERWERSDEEIHGPIVLLLKYLELYPDYVWSMEIPDREFPVRMWYMYGNHKCTMIDVDEVKQAVSIRNYTDNVMFRAFGKNPAPSFEDYQEFLESRCFPRSRDKMKLILQDLGLPFYDPFMIIKKTEGRMAEDNFWIYIEE